MNSTKEKLLDTTYRDYLDLMMYDFPIEKMNELVASDVKGFGSTQDEKFREIQRLRQMVIDQREQGAGVEIQWKKTPINRRISPREDTAIYTDEFSLTMKLKEGEHVIPLRLSSVFEFNDKAWKLVHIHGSTGVDTNEGDTWHQDEWKKKNEELQQLVNEKTEELQKQKRELEIEAALERVRSRTMAMQNYDDLLGVLKLLADQLVKLGIALEIANFSDGLPQPGADWNLWFYMNLDGDSFLDSVTFPHTDHPFFHRIEAAIESYKNGGSNLNKEVFTKEEKDAWIEYSYEQPKFADSPQEMKQYLLDKPGHAWSAVFLKNAWVSIIKNISTPFTDEEDELLKRFANIFGQAYTRFLDLKKAEEQAREAQIEAALERVRSRSIGMLHTSELQEVINTVHQQFNLLNIDITGGVFIAINEENTEELCCWGAGGTADYVERVQIPYYNRPIYSDLLDDIKKGPGFYSEEYSYEEKIKFFNHLFKHPPYTDEPQKHKDEIMSRKGGYTRSCIVLRHTSIFIISHHGKIFSDSDHDILKRFGKVFEQTYTRFIDLQKAEAQAREAEIQLALERVRARTMAMQKSEELADVALVLFQQVKHLGIETWSTGFNIWQEGETSYIDWVVTSAEGRFMEPYTVDLTVHPFFMEISKAKKRGDDFFVIEAEGETLAEHYRLLFKMAKIQFEDIVKAGFQMPEHQINHYVFGKQVSLMFITFNQCPEYHDIFKRLGLAFEQTYTRFLDLQKAEAQAREAKIEAALERVRSSSMAMHKSTELKSVVTLIYKELSTLNISHAGFEIVLCNEKDDQLQFWAATQGLSLYPEPFRISRTSHAFFKTVWKAWKEEKDRLVIELTGNKKREFDRFILENTSYKNVPEETKAFILSREKDVFTYARMKCGLFEAVGDESLNDEEFDILKRFARVFEQTYTRFLDLQKAEAQAREAQIEAALERVRSRTMGMQHSEELQDAAVLLFQQIVALGVPAFGSGFNIWDDDRKYATAWMAGQDRMQPPFKTSSSEDVFLRIYDSAQNGESLFVEEMGGEDLKAHYEYMLSIPVFKGIADKMASVGQSFPEFQIMHCAFFSHGYLMFISFEPVPDSYDIFKRFAKVFEQTYTRFLDLKKAEAQAREAQIEAALERVRSKSIAMRKSEEIADIAGKIFSELRQLDLALNRVLIWTFNDAEKYTTWWSANPEVESTAESYRIDYNETPVFLNYLQAWQQRKPIHLFTLSGDTKKAWEDHLFEHTELSRLPMAVKKGMRSEGTLYTVSVISDYGLMMSGSFEPLPETSIDIIQRFGRVFQQSYTRYLDVQKAEKQAREAEIEMSLERVRAKAMAMHSSKDISGATAIVFDELTRLGIEMERCGIVILNETPIMEVWSTLLSPENKKVIEVVNGKLDSNMHLMLQEVYRAWNDKNKFFAYTLTGEEVQNYYDKLEKEPGYRFPKVKNYPDQQIANCFYFNEGYVFAYTINQLPDDEKRIVLRFTSVFSLTYRRYLDIIKAEKQAREAEIEMSLERVRAKAMAMRSSKDIPGAVAIVFKELSRLGIEMERNGIVLISGETPIMEVWSTRLSPQDQQEVEIISGLLDSRIHPMPLGVYNAWKAGDKFFSYELKGEEVRKYYELLEKQKDYRFPTAQKYSDFQVGNGFPFKEGQIFASTDHHLTEEEKDIFFRFTKVFAHTYQRYIDIVKAEERAREAQIEAALERVRAKAMAMRSSKDIPDATLIVFNELSKLGIELFRAGILIFNETPVMDLWSTPLSPDTKTVDKVITGKLDTRIHPLLDGIYKSWRAHKDYYSYTLEKKDVEDYYNLLKEAPDYKFPKIDSYKDRQINHEFFFKEGAIFGYTKDELTTNEIDIFQRFTKVFSLTYRRYLDIVKAEAQAREAEIEAALERVRSRSMSIQKSTELQLVIGEVITQSQKLGIKLDASLIFPFEDSRDFHFWIASPGHVYAQEIYIPYFPHPFMDDFFDAKERGEHTLDRIHSKEIKDQFYEYAFKHSDLKFVSEERKKQIMNAPGYSDIVAWYKYSGICFLKYESIPYSDSDKNILKRVAAVFEQAYTRFLDLQKAENQAREAEIEMSLERIRAKAMAMRNSQDISDATTIVFNELGRLGIKMARSGIAVFVKESYFEIWSTPLSPKNGKVSNIINGKLNFRIHPMLLASLEHWKKKEAFYAYDMKGRENVRNYYQLLEQQPDYRFPLIKTYPDRQILNSFNFSEGILFSVTTKPLTNEEQNILLRFTKVFALTFRRYQDLIKAEAQAREALKQASLDRVRGEIASMRSKEDLNRITPVIWHELKALQVPFFRCGVFIINEQQQNVRVYLTTPEGKALAALKLPFDANDLTRNSVEHWRKKFIFKAHWNKEEFLNWTHSMMKLGQVKNEESYQGAATAPESLYLHFVPFRQGMLYVGDLSPLEEDKLELIKTLSEAFAIAYARYEDFKNLEDAKNQTEVTLSELKATQSQLIQAEKMASLGQLTAGIAHEIQNPLNFVNNFSEVSTELLEELKEEIEKGDFEEVKEITEDVIQNLAKINHHGKRAESIVKGMLLHSRGNTGQKELTDINSLCDEYLRLSYHGFRAKDKSFNADFRLEASPDLPKLEVVPQEIGRVLLNLINNAFYAVNEKEKQLMNGFKPAVIISTKKLKKAVQIQVQDNGNGVPDSVKDKIFQPFFTTKPTGKGTGLGLSLSYDIVKAHGGDLSVDSKDGEGTEFKISLPII